VAKGNLPQDCWAYAYRLCGPRMCLCLAFPARSHSALSASTACVTVKRAIAELFGQLHGDGIGLSAGTCHRGCAAKDARTCGQDRQRPGVTDSHAPRMPSRIAQSQDADCALRMLHYHALPCRLGAAVCKETALGPKRANRTRPDRTRHERCDASLARCYVSSGWTVGRVEKGTARPPNG